MTTNESLKIKRELANKLVQEILDIKENIENIKLDSEKLYSHIDKKDNDYRKLIQSLNRINSTTENAIDKFRLEKDRIKTLLTQVNSFYEKKFVPLSQIIENKEKGFRAKINQSNK
jgi:DNA anti-recombination protein RmuC